MRRSPSPLTTLPLARAAVDRDAGRRAHENLFDELLDDPATRVLPMWRGRVTTTSASDGAGESDGPAHLALFPPDEVSAALTRVYLGTTLAASPREPIGTPVILAVLTDAAARELQPDDERWHGLRALAARLDDRDAGLATEAVAVANWHATNTHCPRCGTPTVVEMGGWMRRCFVDDNEIFPRTDPAVIVRVLDEDDRLLLGSNALWENNRWSLLAGFVEAGESFEAAVVREVAEESGVVVTDPVYLGSQPWPFPQSLMVGMGARAVPEASQLIPDGEEIVALRWFSRDDVWRERADILLPGPSSIAHAIVRDWYGGPLDEPPPREAA
jgi:NAD+ diphosphatase